MSDTRAYRFSAVRRFGRGRWTVRAHERWGPPAERRPVRCPGYL